MSGRVVSDIQTLAFGSSLYIRYKTAAHVVNSTNQKLIYGPYGRSFIQFASMNDSSYKRNFDLDKNEMRKIAKFGRELL
jgi:hypothetical protein